jgi:hypothetical protein
LYKLGRSTQDETERETKQTKESVHWLNQTSTSNHYTVLLEEGSEDQQHKASPENTPKPPPVYITYVKNSSPLLQLLEQIAKQYKIKALTDKQVKIQPKTSESKLGPAPATIVSKVWRFKVNRIAVVGKDACLYC